MPANGGISCDEMASIWHRDVASLAISVARRLAWLGGVAALKRRLGSAA